MKELSKFTDHENYADKRCYIVASRGRDPDNPSDRFAGNPNLVQRLEINKTGLTNTITSVAKDNWILIECD